MEGVFGRYAPLSQACLFSFKILKAPSSYITSPLFTFQIGPEKKEFTVHSQPLAQLSDVLDKLMNGKLVEAKTKSVDWSDVDEDSFVRLCEYAYLQDYTPPSPLGVGVCFEDTQTGLFEQPDVVDEVLSAAKPEPEPEPESESESVGGSFSSRPKTEFAQLSAKERKRRSREQRLSLQKPRKPASPVVEDLLPYKEKSIWTSHLKDCFSPLAVDVTNNSSHQAREARFSPQANTKDQDFTPVFLGHARLYLLAHKYMIYPLCDLALSKMAQTLDIFTLYRQSVPAVLELVRFVYAETGRFAFATGRLRTLITSYMVSALGQLGDDTTFEALLEDGGDFVSDFWRAVWKAG